jgi:hypothetical protein
VRIEYGHGFGFYAAYGGWAIVLGVALIAAGLGLIACEVFSFPRTNTPA